MAQKQTPFLNKWFKSIERNWDRWESPIQVVFAFSLAIFAIVFPYAFSEATAMTEGGFSLLGLFLSISFWVSVICGWLIIRNSGKVDKDKLDKIEKQLKNISKKLDKMIERLPVNE